MKKSKITRVEIMNKKKTAVEVYISTVFKWGLFILVCACMCATACSM